MLALLGVACGKPAPSALDKPELAAQALIDLAGSGEEPTDEQLDRLFRDLDEKERAGVRDALAGLGSLSTSRVLKVEPLPGGARAAVDLGVELDGGGAAHYSVQCRLGADGLWHVTGFAGPGVSWPVFRAPRDEGLTSSAPPATPPATHPR